MLAVACARAPADPWPGRPPYLGDERVVAVGAETFSPPAQERGDTRQTRLALRAGGAGAQARATALRFVQALVRADAAALSLLLAARVVLTIDGTQKTREELIERCLKDTRALV